MYMCILFIMGVRGVIGLRIRPLGLWDEWVSDKFFFMYILFSIIMILLN